MDNESYSPDNLGILGYFFRNTNPDSDRPNPTLAQNVYS